MSTSTPEEKTPPSDRRVLVGSLSRESQRRVTSREAPASPPVRRPAHVARMLALPTTSRALLTEGWCRIEPQWRSGWG